MLSKIDWSKQELLPAIVQEVTTKRVLMLAYMNKEALELTLKTNYAHFYSRSREKIWKKGESSGNTQKVKEIYLDCDLDTILLKVEQNGKSACHTGRESCFFNRVDIAQEPVQIKEDLNYSISDKLYHILQERKYADEKNSYVASLYKKGDNSILKKVIEEAGEFCLAYKDDDKKEIIYECADLVFHTMVALAYKDINPELIKQELERRFGTSGIEEKKSRKK